MGGSSGITSAMSKIAGFIGNGAKQIITGGNFMIPEIYRDSNYDKSYSFSITAATPYGNKMAWFINVGIVLAHILPLVLPIHVSANTYKSPFLLKVFSPGWYNCSLGICDSVSLEKGSDQSWSVYGLPNEIRISVSIKDLYSGLTMPGTTKQFMQNSGMLEFLMVNCGVDITNQDLSTKWQVWVAMLESQIKDAVRVTPYNIIYKTRDKLVHKLTLID
jgi:hypothetical protein